LFIGFPSLGAEARLEVRDGRAELVAALLPARNRYGVVWWHQEIARSAHAVMLRGRFPLATAPPSPSLPPLWSGAPARSRSLHSGPSFLNAWHIEDGNP
jgi:hypothetical protein